MPEASEQTNGHFELFYRHGWAYLTVFPPAAGGTPVYHEQVQNRMRLLGVPKVTSTRIRSIIAEASGEPERLVEWPEGAHLASNIDVEVAEDGMAAWVTIQAPKRGAAPPSWEDVVEALESQGVSYGIDRSTIATLLKRADFGKEVLAASGDEVVHAQSARVLYHFSTNRGKPYLEMDFGRINLKELNFIENKEEGDLLAELIPPVPAKNGRKVSGEVIIANTAREKVEIRAGKNTRLSKDRLQLFATDDGNVRLTHGSVIIEPVVTVESVDYETGNIHFEGSVVVENGIADGFIVEAGGDVQVGKGVGRATIKAGGNVLLKTGINGNGEGRIQCGGNLFAKYVESSAVGCEGNIFVEEAIMHSRVSAGQHCVLNGRRAEVIASDVVVGGSLWCKKLGSIYEAPTHVYIGVRPKLLERYRAARASLEANQEELGKAEEQLEQLGRAMNEGKRDERVRAARDTLKARIAELHKATPTLHHDVNSLRDQLTAARESFLVAEDTIFNGAVVLFGKTEYRAPASGARKTILKAGEREVIESGFNPYDRPVLIFE